MRGKKLQSSGFRVFHADDDADVLIMMQRPSKYYEPQTRLLLDMIPTYLFFTLSRQKHQIIRYFLSSRTQAGCDEKAHYCQHPFSCQETWYGTV